MSNFLRGIVLLIGILLVGCQPSEPEFGALEPLTGTLKRDGKPVAGGGLIFTPESGRWNGVVVDASVNSDGTFEARTSRTTGRGTVFTPGVATGSYKVTFHPIHDGSKTGLDTELKTIVEIKAGDNRVELELPSAMPKGAGEERDEHKTGDTKKD